jgi:hypothetical protein
LVPLLTFPITPKPVLGVVQTGVVTNHEKPSDDDDNSFEKKHNPRMPQIFPTKKSYNERKGKPSPIGDDGGFFVYNIPVNGGGVKPFAANYNDPLGGGGSRPSGDQYP